MSRTSSILTSSDDRAGFAAFLGFALTLAERDKEWLETQFHRGAISRYERRAADVQGYLAGDKIPELANLDYLRTPLEIPVGAMLTAAGYIEVVLATLASAAQRNEVNDWEWNQSPRGAALERLLSLFPSQEMDAALNQSASLVWIFEKSGRLNHMSETEKLHRLWPFWVWVMPRVFERKDFIRKESLDLKAHFALDSSQSKAPETTNVYRAIKAKREFSLADSVSDFLFQNFYSDSIAESDQLLLSALACLKDKKQSWSDRAKLATHYLHQWANELYGDLTQGLRRRIKGLRETPITEEMEAYELGMIALDENDVKSKPKPRPSFE